MPLMLRLVCLILSVQILSALRIFRSRPEAPPSAKRCYEEFVNCASLNVKKTTSTIKANLDDNQVCLSELDKHFAKCILPKICIHKRNEDDDDQCLVSCAATNFCSHIKDLLQSKGAKKMKTKGFDEIFGDYIEECVRKKCKINKSDQAIIVAKPGKEGKGAVPYASPGLNQRSIDDTKEESAEPESPKVETPKKGSKKAKEASKEVPKEASKEVPKDGSGETSYEGTISFSIGFKRNKKVEKPKEVAKAGAKVVPKEVEAAEDVPKAVPKAVPTETVTTEGAVW